MVFAVLEAQGQGRRGGGLLITVTLKFGEDGHTNFKFIDCVAYVESAVVEETDKYGGERVRGDYLAGLVHAGYEVQRRGRHFFFGPSQVLGAVDRAIDEAEYPPEYVI